ncbi:hypothetical protein BT93_L1555 [Corymbia citriodora subsp. variegata]|uniref:Uncharacterized protein n=1 Tax=Corymbia citriodora subsp. variegata TaxID=360336 RepID=A0A8T0CNK5_CORYI|nr:hypothetical protein BT93_L1555 [Corymbia citriodora subsp. variegata]
MASKELWTIDHFSPNDSSHFHISIRVKDYDITSSAMITVKKCGFRLMCKPLENDSEVLLQDNQLLDPALLYEVLHEDNPISTKEESSSETKYLQVRNMIDFSIEVSLSLRMCICMEMPKEFVLVEDGTISFMASQDLYDKLVGLYICVVFGVEGGKKEVSFNIVPYINDQRRNKLSGTLDPFDMDHMWFQYFTLPKLWGALEGEVNFGQFGESYLRFSLNIRVVGATVKKLGYVIQSCRLEDALKVEIEKNRLMDVASLYEDDIARPNRAWYKYRLWRIFGMEGSRLGSQDTSLRELLFGY